MIQRIDTRGTRMAAGSVPMLHGAMSGACESSYPLGRVIRHAVGEKSDHPK